MVEGPGYPSPVHLLSVDQILLKLFENLDLVVLSGIKLKNNTKFVEIMVLKNQYKVQSIDTKGGYQ